MLLILCIKDVAFFRVIATHTIHNLFKLRFRKIPENWNARIPPEFSEKSFGKWCLKNPTSSLDTSLQFNFSTVVLMRIKKSVVQNRIFELCVDRNALKMYTWMNDNHHPSMNALTNVKSRTSDKMRFIFAPIRSIDMKNFSWMRCILFINNGSCSPKHLEMRQTSGVVNNTLTHTFKQNK